MRYAVVSDLHANLEAVVAVFATIDRLGVDELVCLGDIVGYHANPNEVIDLVRARAHHVVAGNHDRAAVHSMTPDYFSGRAREAIEWTRTRVSAANRSYLAALPVSRHLEDRVLILHGAAHPAPNENVRLSDETAALASFAALEAQHPEIDVCLFGHIHLPLAYAWHGGRVTTLRSDRFTLEPGVRYLINPGSVGQPRDGDPRSAFMVLDSARRTVEYHRVPYDGAVTRARAERAGLIRSRPLWRRAAGAINRRVRSWWRLTRS
jgi:predicted phosphodiesterase